MLPYGISASPHPRGTTSRGATVVGMDESNSSTALGALHHTLGALHLYHLPWHRRGDSRALSAPRHPSARLRFAPSQHRSDAARSQPHVSPTSLPRAPPAHRVFLFVASLSLSLSYHSWLKLRWNFVFLSSEFGPGKSLPAIPVASQRTSRLHVIYMI